MTDPDGPDTDGPDPDGQGAAEAERKPGIMRRVVGPAAAIVVAYASVLAFPALLVNQAPPINGDHLFVVFIIGLVFFSALALYFDKRESREDPEE